MSTNPLENTHPYKQIVDILEMAQENVATIVPNFPKQEDPKQFDSAYNTKIAQAIWLMTKTLAEPGRNKKVGSWAMRHLRPILLGCIDTLTEKKDKALPIPNLNAAEADDTTFKLCVVYLSVLKGLDVDFCPSVKDYISVLSWAGKEWMDNLTIKSPEKLTNDLMAYFKTLDSARQTDLLSFVEKSGLDDLKVKLDYSVQAQEIKKVGEQLDRITLKKTPWNILIRAIQRARNIKLNKKGHYLLSVNDEANFPKQFLADKPTLIKYKNDSGEAAFKVFHYEWPSTFSMQMSTEPQNIADIKLSESDKERYQVGIIRVTDPNTVYYVDLEKKTIKKLGYSHVDLTKLDELIKPSTVSRSLGTTILRNIESIDAAVLADAGRKLVQFDLSADAEGLNDQNLVFPEIGAQVSSIAYDEEKHRSLYKHIVKSYTNQVSYQKSVSSQDPSEQISAIEKSISTNKETLVRLQSESASLKQTNAELETKIANDRASLSDPSAQYLPSAVNTVAHLGFDAAEAIANIPLIHNLALGALPSAVNYFKQSFISLVEPGLNTLNELEKKLKDQKETEIKLNAQIEELNQSVAQDSKKLLELRLERFHIQALRAFSDKCAEYATQMSARLSRFQSKGTSKNEELDQKIKETKKNLLDLREDLDAQLKAFGEEINPSGILNEALNPLFVKAQLSFNELNARVKSVDEQELKIQSMEETAALYFSLKQKTKKLQRNFALLVHMLWNSPVLPYFALLSGVIALTIALGLLLSNPHFLAVFVISSIASMTAPLAITGVAVVGALALGSAVKIATGYRFFKSAPKENVVAAADKKVVNVEGASPVEQKETAAETTKEWNWMNPLNISFSK